MGEVGEIALQFALSRQRQSTQQPSLLKFRFFRIDGLKMFRLLHHPRAQKTKLSVYPYCPIKLPMNPTNDILKDARLT